MTDRRAFIATVAASLLAPVVAAAQRVGKLPHIGYVVPGPPACRSPGAVWLGIRDAFLDGLNQYGFVPEQNVRWEPQCVPTDTVLPDVVADLVRQAPDVIVVTGTHAALAAQRATRTIPIVFTTVADPVAVGLVSNLARPGGNITGLTNVARELSQKRLELLREMMPRLRRVAVLLDPVPEHTPMVWSETGEAARSTGITLVRFEARSADEIDLLFPKIAASGVDALLLLPSFLLWAQRERIARLALQHRLASIAPPPGFVHGGALMEYGPSDREIFRNAGKYVGRILKGVKAGDLPVEQPRKFELALNLKTAKALGLTIPPSLLLRAEQLVE